MRTGPGRFRAYLTCVALLLSCFSTLALAEAPKHTSDKIIFVKDQALWVVEPSGGDPTRLLDLPFPAEEVEELRVSSKGTALLVSGKSYLGWAALSDEGASPLRLLPCSGPHQLSENGNRVVCGTQDTERIAIYTLAPKLGVEIIERKASGPLAFAESASEIVSFGDNDDVIAVSQKGERVLATHRPQSAMKVTPDGKRAVGAYNEGTIHVVYTFRLDGKASKRTLVHAARAIQISANSKWVAVQQEVDACAVRIAGGQYMCWRRFSALSISSQGKSLLVSRKSSGKTELLLGAVNGVSSKKPTPLVQGALGAATFWAQPAAE